jgi:uncharacterized protein (DUF1684 family)
MKKITTFLLLCAFMLDGSAQSNDGAAQYQEFWEETTAEFKNPEKSPLPKDNISGFDSIPRYAYKDDYRVKARWEKLKGEKPLKFETTGKIKQRYQKVGVLHFKLNGEDIELPAYQNLSLMRTPGFESYLFVPFTDLSNGAETYGGGRYLDFSKSENDSVIVDFNRAYNPYCHYSDRYSCPIPPKENHLPVKILAGARTYSEEH